MSADITTAVRILNEAFAADPAAIETLLSVSYNCNQALADHPTVQIREGEYGPRIGSLGLINGIVDAMTGERVAAIYGENGLEGFTLYKRQ